MVLLTPRGDPPPNILPAKTPESVYEKSMQSANWNYLCPHLRQGMSQNQV